MNIKRDKLTLLASFLLLMFLSGLFAGCLSYEGGGYATKEKEGKYRGPSEHLKGLYDLKFPEENHFETDAKESVLNGKDAKAQRRPEVRMLVDIHPKDDKTLEVKYRPSGETSEKTFTMKYDEKTGKAKGKDADGYEWEIQFESEKQDKYEDYDDSGMKHVLSTYKRSRRYIEMSYIKREKSGALGMGKEVMEGYSIASGANYAFTDEALKEENRKENEELDRQEREYDKKIRSQ